MSVSVDASPADSPLERVIFGGFDCQQFETTAGPVLYEVDQQGTVVSTISLFLLNDQKVYARTPVLAGLRFVVRDGCLTFGQEAESPVMGRPKAATARRPQTQPPLRS